MNFATSIFTIILFFTSTVLAKDFTVPSAILYESENFTGAHVVLVDDTGYMADMSQVKFGNKAQSYCLFGTWVFFENNFFNQGKHGGVEYLYGGGCTGRCGTFGGGVSGKISSALRIGNPLDYLNDTLTLFTHEKFQGVNFRYYENGEAGTMFSKFYKSLIITGSSNWTLFLGEDKKKKCIKVQGTGEPLFISDLKNAEVDYESIKGLVRGCE